MKMDVFAMPAWIAGIQIRRMRPERNPRQPGFQHSMLE